MQRVLFSLATFAALFTCSVGAAEDITLGAILPLTGNAADQGEWARRGFELAKKKIAEKEGIKFKLVYEDSKGADPATAVLAYKSLVARTGPVAVFTSGSGVGMALSPLANRDGVVLMGVATATPKYRSEGDFTFRNFPSASLETVFLADALKSQLKVQRLALLSINNEYGVGTSGAAKKAFTEKGGEVVFEESYDPSTTDFKSILLKLRQVKVDAVYLASMPTDGALLLKQARELKLENRFIASVAIIGGKEFFSLAGDAAENLLVVSTAINGQNEFSQIYNRAYPGESSGQQIYVARAYDALMLVAQAINTCSPVSALCVRDELLKGKNFPGASGNISFDSAGEISPSFNLFVIHQREFHPFTPQ